jgi:hypothetical protein
MLSGDWLTKLARGDSGEKEPKRAPGRLGVTLRQFWHIRGMSG